MRSLVSAVTRSSAVLLSTTILCTSASALAQDAAAEDDADIVVTATKREQNLQDVPLAINAIGTERLDELQVKELSDVVKFLPSVTIQTAAPGFSQIYFRGVASGENANHSTSLPTVGTYLDEAPITTIQGALDIHAYDLARVEALAGPQGTLYGASSMAGTIKLITNKPDTSGTYGSVGVEVNTVEGAGGGLIEGFLNAPISENAAARIVAYYRRDAGYIDNVAGSRTYPSSGITQDNANLVRRNYNDVDTVGGRIALGIDLDDDWTIRPVLMAQLQEVNGSFAQERSRAVSGKLETVQYNPESSKDQWVQAALTIEGKIGSWDLTLAGGHLRRQTETESDYSDYAFFYDAISGYGSFFYDNNNTLVNPNQYIQAVDRYRKTFAEARIASPSDARLRFIGGLFYQRQSHNIEQNYIIDNIADVITVPGTDSNIWLTKQLRVDRDYAAFGELSYDVTDKLTLTAGGRVYRFDNSLFGFFGFARGYSGNTGVARCVTTNGLLFRDDPTGAFAEPILPGAPCTNVNRSTAETDAIWKVNASYRLNDDALVYATWSRGFRPGGINRRGTLPPYGPDTLDNYEFGWKTNFGPVRFNGAIYQQDWNGIQLSFIGANGLSEVRNAGIARIRGVEVDLGYRAGGLSLNIGASYNDATIRRDFCAIANATFDCTINSDLDGSGAIDAGNEFNSTLAPSGTRLPITAKFKGNAVARYEFPLGGLDGHVQVAANHIGKRRSDLRTLQNGIKGSFGAYTTVDLSAGVKSGNWGAELFATNLFNSNGVVNSGLQCQETICGDPGDVSGAGGTFYDTVVRPRLIGLKLSLDF